jgi:hypothetical protein
MKLNLRAFFLTTGILWAVAFFLMGLLNLFWPEYGGAFLQLMNSVYPGYHASRTFGDLIVGTLYALVDGTTSGLIFGFGYNFFVGTFVRK